MWKYIDVHGGVGFVGEYERADLEFQPPVRRWWVGFNTSHKFDLQPLPIKDAKDDSAIVPFGSVGKIYRTEQYVKDQTNELASQLKVIEEKD
jgi:hypothetical protein